MRRVRLQAGEERDHLRNEGKKLERAVLDKVRDETNKQLADADARLAIEAARLRAELQRDVPMLAQDIAKKFLHREVR
jgi:F0F1-type ATP synthase membrane subunit b/b'